MLCRSRPWTASGFDAVPASPHRCAGAAGVLVVDADRFAVTADRSAGIAVVHRSPALRTTGRSPVTPGWGGWRCGRCVRGCRWMSLGAADLDRLSRCHSGREVSTPATLTDPRPAVVGREGRNGPREGLIPGAALGLERTGGRF